MPMCEALKCTQGVFFSEDEVNEAAQVVVIDANTQKDLGLTSPVEGKIILVGKKPLRIIGLAEESNNMNQTSLKLWTPYTTLMQRISGEKSIDSLTVKIKDNVESQTAEKALPSCLQLNTAKRFLYYEFRYYQTNHHKHHQHNDIANLFDCINFTCCGGHWRDEYNVSFSNRTYERNWRADGDWGETE